jgi:signal transduction histidine kinase
MIPLSLSARLSIVFCTLLLASGAAAAWLQVRANTMYEQEVLQRLSSDVAEHIAASAQFMDENGLKPDAVRILFDQLMSVNPSVEVYLLDGAGNVVGDAAPAGRVRRARVEVAPIERLLGGAPLPVLGDDPRSPSGRKVFDAARLELGGRPWGYVYVILMGETRDLLAADVTASRVLRTTLWSMAVVALLTGVAGLVASRRITRPLRALTAEMQALDLDRLVAGGSPPLPQGETRNERDEIAVLRGAFGRLGARIAEQWRALKSQDRQRRELVANVSHDLRTPLTSLHGFLETLAHKESLSDAERRRYLEIALGQSAKVSRLAHELFELARLEHDTSTPDEEPFSIADLVHDLLQELALLAGEKRQRLVADVPPDLPNVVGSLALVERALTNLIDNAIRHTDAGSEVRVSLRATDGGVEVAVRDDGRGIAPARRAALLERTASPGADRGTGLGLLIVRRIVEMHGARLAIDASESGTSVRFVLRTEARHRERPADACPPRPG